VRRLVFSHSTRVLTLRADISLTGTDMSRLAIAATAVALGGGVSLYHHLQVGQVVNRLRHDFCACCNDKHAAVVFKSE